MSSVSASTRNSAVILTYLGSHWAVVEGRRNRHTHLAAGVEGGCSRRVLLAEGAHCSHSWAGEEECRSHNLLAAGKAVVNIAVEEGRNYRAAERRSRPVRERTTSKGWER